LYTSSKPIFNCFLQQLKQWGMKQGSFSFASYFFRLPSSDGAEALDKRDRL
jgi:hypothetical protein